MLVFVIVVLCCCCVVSPLPPPSSLTPSTSSTWQCCPLPPSFLLHSTPPFPLVHPLISIFLSSVCVCPFCDVIPEDMDARWTNSGLSLLNLFILPFYLILFPGLPSHSPPLISIIFSLFTGSSCSVLSIVFSFHTLSFCCLRLFVANIYGFVATVHEMKKTILLTWIFSVSHSHPQYIL